MNTEYSRQTIEAAAAIVRKEFTASQPHWQYPADSPLKYVDWALQETITKCELLAGYLHPTPGQRIYEFGPGTGYLTYILQTKYHCYAYSCDIPGRPLLYWATHDLLGIATHTTLESVVPQQPLRNIKLLGGFDYIIATQISWMNDWTPADLLYFLNDCSKSLMFGGGKIVLFPNPQAFGGIPITTLLPKAEVVELPHLGSGVVLDYSTPKAP